MYVCVCVGFGSSFRGKAPGIAENPKCPEVGTSASAIPSSPAWHRRRRHKRAKARRQIWTARNQGLPGPYKAAVLLAEHHTRPQYRELMSGGQRRPPWTRGNAADSYQTYYEERGAKAKSGKGWDYWRGSWVTTRYSCHRSGRSHSSV